MIKDGYSLLLPSGFTDYFDITQVEEKASAITIYLSEKLDLLSQEKNSNLESKGYLPEVIIQDFPLRGKALFLKIKRRRWVNKETGEYVSRPIRIEASGTRLTAEFAAFLKGLHR
ncbi:hypothetical protein M2138_000409 [Dysgonomonadaceae bacterium PH5-43]|nr:hypothetical protein [Dysgonomonadaceae bacterium PH5-43]